MTVKSTVRSAVRSAIRGTVRSGGALLPEWTPIYDGLTTFGELYSVWQPSGNNWEVEVEVSSMPDLDINQFIMSGGVATSLFKQRSGFNHKVAFTDTVGNVISTNPLLADTYARIKVLGQSTTTQLSVGDDVYSGSFASSPTLSNIASSTNIDSFLKGQIQRIKLLDHDDPSNSIDINTVKRSKDAPNASDNKLVNSLNGQEVGSITNLTGYELVNKGE